MFERGLARGGSIETARTAVVNMLLLGELVHLFNLRHFSTHAFASNELSGNPAAFWASIILLALQCLFTYAPPMQDMFHTTSLTLTSWLPILALAGALLPAVEAEKWLLRHLQRRRM